MSNTNKNKQADDFLVNVWMVTYNHEKFIAQAIESVLMQKTTFRFKIIIGEDCSTDSTRAICIEYQKKHPDKIELLLHKKNLGSQKNSYVVHQACKAKYVAMLEGDDYWTDPLKLQTQVDFMENNPASAACFHKVSVKDRNGNILQTVPNNEIKSNYNIEEVIAFPRTGWYIMTSSILYRKSFIKLVPEWFSELKIGDFTIIMLAALNGSINFINKSMGTYRENPNSLMRTPAYSENNVTLKLIQLYKAFDKHTNLIFRDAIDKQLLYFFYKLIIHNKSKKKSLQQFKFTVKYNYHNVRLKNKPKNIKDYFLLWGNYCRFLFVEVKTY